MLLSYEDIHTFPKADLHLHLDGALPAEVMIRLAKKYGVNLPTYDLEEFKKLYNFKNAPPSKGLELFAWPIAVTRTSEGLEEAVYEVILNLASQNILYTELRFAPGYHSAYHPAHFYDPNVYEQEAFPVMSLDLVIQSALRGVKRGYQDTGVVANLTLCIPRESIDQYGEESTLEIARLAIKYKDQGVVSLDLACYETPYPPHLYTKAFSLAKEAGLKRNPHAGEMADTATNLANIKDSIALLHANGLGHAYPLHLSKSLMQLVAQHQVRIERHPLGDFAPPLEQSGIDLLLENGVPLCIVSDDPALYVQTLTQNIKAVLDTYNWQEEKLHLLTANSLNHAFFGAGQKDQVIHSFVERGFDPSFLIG